MKISYTSPKNIRPATRKLLDQIMIILDEYANEGYKLTLRQLYYQLVTKLVIDNTTRMYARLSTILKDARMCGQVDWDVIEDRVRVPQIPNEFDDVKDLMNNFIYWYRKDRHRGQKNYVEVWVEKDALSGVLLPITKDYHVHLMVNRGYSSVSAMHDAAIRFQHALDEGKDCTILYLGDHDPSGLDMIRDISDRLLTFGVDVNVKQIALTIEQIKQYNPPPNPAKEDDPRAKEYIEKFGEISWELDALKPQVLVKLLQKNLELLIDMGMYDEIIFEEEKEKGKLEKLVVEMF